MNIQLKSFNLSADVRMILIGLCRISSKRDIRYVLQDRGDDDFQDDNGWIDTDSVLIINGEDEASVARWQEVKSRKPSIMSVLINNDEFGDNMTTYSVGRDSLGVKLLDLLDNIAKSRKDSPSQLEKALPEHDKSSDMSRNEFQAPQSEGSSQDASNRKASSPLDVMSFFESTEQRALIVDDSASVRRQLKEFLKKKGFSVEEAASASEALNKAQNRDFSIIFLDIVMPEMDGYKACKKLKKINRCVNTPVVMLTSKSSTFNKARGILAGCDAYLTKPVKVNRLNQILLEKAPSSLGV